MNIRKKVNHHVSKLHQAVKKAVSPPERKLENKCPDVDVSLEGSQSRESSRGLTQLLHNLNRSGNESVSRLPGKAARQLQKDPGPAPA